MPDRKAIDIIKRVRNNPDAEVIIYRTIEKWDAKEFFPWDWVSLTKEYAKEHGQWPLKWNAILIEKKVKVKDLVWNADSLQEYWYRPDWHTDYKSEQLKQIREQANKKPLPTLPKKWLPKLPKGEVLEQDMDILNYSDEDTLFYAKNSNWWIRYTSSKQEVKDTIIAYEKRGLSTEEISNKIQEKYWIVDKKMVLPNDAKEKISNSKYISDKITVPRTLYRWVWKWWPTGTAKFWEGIYSSPNYKNAKAYWDVKTLTSEAIPNSPLQFKNFAEYENWLDYDVAKALWVDWKRWVDKMYPDIWAIVKQMWYDWITLWPKDDMYVVKFTNKTWIWSLPPLPKKWK